MKNLLLSLLTIIIMIGCNKKKDDERVNFYLSQSRDTNLVGWWVHPNNGDSIFFNFQSSGLLLQGKKENNKYSTMFTDYWYTKDNYFHKLERYDGFNQNSIESKQKYQIVNDTLWVSSGDNDNLTEYRFKTYPRE